MQYETAAHRQIDGTGTLVQIRGGVARSQQIDMYRFVRNAARNALVDHVYHAADRLAAIKQHGRTPQNLDAFGGKRINRNRMIGAGIRSVDGADPVDQGANALTLQTT